MIKKIFKNLFGTDRRASEQLSTKILPPTLPSANETSPVTVPYYDHWSNHPSKKLNPSKLATILENAERGDVREQIELFEDVLEKDPTIESVFNTRKLAVVGCDWEIQPNDGSRAARKQTEFVQDVLDNLSSQELTENSRTDFLSFDDLRMHLLDSIAKGFSIAQLNWSTEKNEWRIESAQAVNQKHLIFGNPGDPEWNPYEVRIRTIEEMAIGIPLPPYNYIVQFNKSKSGYATRMALLRTLVWYYLFKNFGYKSLTMYAELIGTPMRIGKYDPNDPEGKAIIEKAVKGFGTDFAAIISKMSEIEIIDNAKGTNNTIHQTLIGLVNAEIAKCVLGQTLTTEVGAVGSYAASKTHDAVRNDIKEADAKAEEKNIQLKIVKPLCDFNFGSVQCKYVVKYRDQEDLNTKATRYQTLSTFVPISVKHIYEEFEIPAPEEGERTTTPQVASPLGLPMKRDAHES